MRHTILTTIAIATIFPFGISRSDIVKCRDTSGQWHYGDEAGRACGNQNIYVLNGSGVVVREIASPEAKKRAAEETRAMQQQRETDRRLLATYTGPDDIKQTRDRRLQELARDRHSINETLLILEQTLARMKAVAAVSSPPPVSLKKDIQETQSQILVQRAALAAVDARTKAARAQYDEALKRYQALEAEPH